MLACIKFGAALDTISCRVVWLHIMYTAILLSLEPLLMEYHNHMVNRVGTGFRHVCVAIGSRAM